MAKISINLTEGSLNVSQLCVGIDLGTTNSLVAWFDPTANNAVIIQDEKGRSSIPSLAFRSPDGSLKVGYDALESNASFSGTVLHSVKRFMGMSPEYFDSELASISRSHLLSISPNNGKLIFWNNDMYTPEYISSKILSNLKEQAEFQLGKPVIKAVITVPAYFNDSQRLATKEAGKLAGLDVLRVINEPTAASLAYGFGIDNLNKCVAIYDFGGGTFDISVLNISNGVFEVLSTHGNTQLGGDDFDAAIISYWKSIINDIADIPALNAESIRMLAIKAKHHLTSNFEFSEVLHGINFSLTRDTFESLILPIIDKTLVACTYALKDADCSIDDIDEVILVGGSTRTPLVIDKISRYFNRPVRHSVDPDQVVALGAAIQANILCGNSRDTLLLDVTPLSLGIETSNGLMDVIIPRNTKIPASVSRQYTTQKDGQSGIVISVFQGERDLVKDNRKLASFILKGIPSMPAGMAKVQVSFQINADGILQVIARELRSGIEQIILINEHLGLDDTVIESMIEDSFLNASMDISIRRLTEIRFQAEQLIYQAESFISKNKESLTEAECVLISQSIKMLKEEIDNGNSAEMQFKIDLLDKLAKPIAERIMDQSISNALKGQSIKN